MLTLHKQSSVDLLERLEEDRKRRLRSIANVAARTPIGLGGVEDRGHAGNNQSPKPKGGQNDYSKYRYYPPSSETSASLHESYQQKERLTTPASVNSGRRDRHRGRKHASSTGGGSLGGDTTRDGAKTPVDGGSSFELVDFDNSTSFSPRNRSSISTRSPAINPRGGGGYQSAGRNGRPRPVYHYQRQQQQQQQQQQSSLDMSQSSGMNIDTTVMGESSTGDYITPTNAAVQQTPGHGASEAVYTQRMTSRRRRRADEM